MNFMKKPILLHYYITDNCNAKCEYCDIWKQKTAGCAKFEDLERNLIAAKRLGAKFVDFTGGEPLLNPDLPKFLDFAKKKKFITSVTTNAILFEKYAPQLKGKIDLLHFSIGGNKDTHDKIRGVKSFDVLVKAIDVAREFNLFPDLLFTYTDDNIDCFEEVYAIAQSHKLILILDPVFSTDGKNLLSEQTQIKAKSFAKKAGVYLNSAHLKLREKGGNNTQKPTCRAIDSTIVILPDDTLALPCFHRFRAKLKIDGNLEQILKSDEITQFRKLQGKLQICENCHINCYMDASYQYSVNSFFFSSILSKLKYSYWKYLIFRRKLPF